MQLRLLNQARPVCAIRLALLDPLPWMRAHVGSGCFAQHVTHDTEDEPSFKITFVDKITWHRRGLETLDQPSFEFCY